MRASLLLMSACASEFGLGAVLEVHPEDVTECLFEPVDGFEDLHSYTCNPVFTATAEGWADGVGHLTFSHADVLGHPFYQLWYTGRTAEGQTQIGTAVSADGTTWEPHPRNPGWPTIGGREWDGGPVQQIKVAYDAEARAYRMLYGAFTTDLQTGGVGLASSRDGVVWQRMPANPVLSLNVPRGGVDIAWPVSYDIHRGQHRALFAAASDIDRLDLYQVTTNTPERWDDDVPVRALRAGRTDSWDDEGFIDAAVVQLDGVWWLFYVGFGTWLEDTENNVRYAQASYLGLARSDDDGESWQRVGDEPVPINQTPEGDVNSVAARVIGPRIHVWVGDTYPDEGGNAVGYYLFEPAQ